MTPSGLSALLARRVVDAIADPELGGVSIGDLGVVVDVTATDAGAVDVVLTPTFLGCPALGLIEADVRAALLSAGASSASVRYVHVPMWSPLRISPVGRERLAAHGIAVPGPDGSCACPFCGTDALAAASPVGPTACRSVWWCSACRNVVEVMRGPEPVVLGPSRAERASHAHV